MMIGMSLNFRRIFQARCIKCNSASDSWLEIFTRFTLTNLWPVAFYFPMKTKKKYFNSYLLNTCCHKQNHLHVNIFIHAYMLFINCLCRWDTGWHFKVIVADSPIKQCRSHRSELTVAYRQQGSLPYLWRQYGCCTGFIGRGFEMFRWKRETSCGLYNHVTIVSKYTQVRWIGCFTSQSTIFRHIYLNEHAHKKTSQYGISPTVLLLAKLWHIQGWQFYYI